MMAQPTQQTSAINAALEVVSLASQFQDLLKQCQLLSEKITINNYLTTLGALPTAAWNSDGSIGSADGTPNAQHPITTSQLYLPSNDITGGVYMINDFISFMTNATVSTSDRNGTAAKLVK